MSECLRVGNPPRLIGIWINHRISTKCTVVRSIMDRARNVCSTVLGQEMEQSGKVLRYNSYTQWIIEYQGLGDTKEPVTHPKTGEPIRKPNTSLFPIVQVWLRLTKKTSSTHLYRSVSKAPTYSNPCYCIFSMFKRRMLSTNGKSQADGCKYSLTKSKEHSKEGNNLAIH